MNLSFRILLITLFTVVAAASARAHPHVWVTMRSELIYAPDGSATGIRQSWEFDDMFSAFATQGIASKVKGQFTREELRDLAKTNVESLKEYDYFTYAKADGAKAEFSDPLPDYYLDYANAVLTLHFTLPFKKPVKAKNLEISIYDPTIFVDFEFAKEDPAHVSGLPPQCKAQVELPRKMTFLEEKKLADADINNPGTWGQAFANKIVVNCP